MHIQFSSLIKNQFNSMSETNQIISKKVLEHINDIDTYSVKEFAIESNVSPAMIIKFSKIVGFSGFDELKYAAKYSMDSRGTYVDAITNTLALVDERNKDVYAKFANLIHNHNQITIFSRSNSANSAFDFYYKFMRVKSGFSFYRTTSEQINALMNLHPDDLLLLVSNSGNAKELIEVCQKVTTSMISPANILLITNNPKAKLSEFANTIIVGARNEKESEFSQYIPFSAKYSLMFMLDSIFFSYFNLYREECTDKLNQWRFHLE